MGPESLLSTLIPVRHQETHCYQGIDMLSLVKSEQQLQEETQAQQEAQAQQSLVDQAGQLASSPLADPSKNPALGEAIDSGELGQALEGSPEEPGAEEA